MCNNINIVRIKPKSENPKKIDAVIPESASHLQIVNAFE